MAGLILFFRKSVFDSERQHCADKYKSSLTTPLYLHLRSKQLHLKVPVQHSGFEGGFNIVIIILFTMYLLAPISLNKLTHSPYLAASRQILGCVLSSCLSPGQSSVNWMMPADK